MIHQPDRRRLLQLACAAAACTWLPRGLYAQPRWSASPFALGVASGSPSSDGVVLWTRLVAPTLFEALGSQPVAVRWEVADDEGFARVVASGQTVALPALAHSVHAEVTGLAPDRWYFFRFSSGNAQSPVGRTRTLPAPDAAAQRLRLGFGSCQRWELGYYAAWRHLAAEQPDLVLFLGDYIYEYPGTASAVRLIGQPGVVHSLADYRARHALHKSDADLQAMHAACPWLVVWDDHEVQNDYAGVHEGDHRPFGLNASGDFAARRAAAYQAYYEHMPLPASALARAQSRVQNIRLYGRWRWGRLADLVLLDTRQHRDRQPCAPAGQPSASLDPAACSAWADPSRSLLGTAQEAWLEETLARSGTGWTVLGQQSLFGARDNQAGPGQRFWNDGWDGYGAARRRLTGALEKHRPANPVFLGGDVHENWVGHVKADYSRPDSMSLGVEFCGTSISSPAGGAALAARRLAENPHFVHADGSQRGYGVCDFTPGRLHTRLRVLDDVTRPDAQVQTQAAFMVEAGRPVLERL